MKILLCKGDTCVRPLCPAVEIMEDRVLIGEDDNMCALTHEQFKILKEKIKNNEI